jgi:hypothetical protein
VQRILSGNAPDASVANVLAIATALGIRFEMGAAGSPTRFLCCGP